MKTIVTAALMSFAFAGAVTAQTTASLPASANETFTKMDSNGDNSISRAEFDKYAEGYAARERENFEKQFAELDVNKDGKVDKEESGANAALEAYFDQIDQDGDTFLTKEEIGSAVRAAHEASASR